MSGICDLFSQHWQPNEIDSLFVHKIIKIKIYISVSDGNMRSSVETFFIPTNAVEWVHSFFFQIVLHMDHIGQNFHAH